jgi:hypothetical protein
LNPARKLFATLALLAGCGAIVANVATPGQQGAAAASTPSVASSSSGGTHSVVLAGIRMTDVVSNGIRMTD